MKDSPLKKQVSQGVLWNFTELMLRRGAGGVTTIILAWFLSPDDFGLIAMMAVFLGFANVLVDAGMSQALIRKKSVSSIELDSAFYINILLGLIIYWALFLSAPLIANFYKQDILHELIRVASLSVVINALSVVQRSILTRDLKFKLQMRVSLPATVLSGIVAIVLAFLGYGVWALVSQVILQALLNSFFYWRLQLWRPNLAFSWSAVRVLFSFSGYLIIANSTNIPFKNMYVIVIAKLFSTSIAGLYFFAEKIRDLMLEQLVSSIQTVTYPTLARLQEEPERLKNGYRQVISVMTFLLFPVLVFLSVFVEALFDLFMPSAWQGAAVYLQLMCIAALLNPLHATNVNILKVKGRSDLVLTLGIFKKFVAILMLLFTFRYGIVGIILGQIASSVIAYLPNSFFSKQLINYSSLEQLSDFIPSLLLSGVIGGILFYLQLFLDWSVHVEVLILGIGGCMAYLVVAHLLKLRGLGLAIELIRLRRERRSS